MCHVQNNLPLGRTVGYYRYDTVKQEELLRGLYARLRLYSNFFLPVMKLKEKVRNGSKLTRRYDHPQTPYRRVLGHPQIPQQTKDALTAQYATPNVIVLRRQLTTFQTLLFRTAAQAGPPPQPSRSYHYPAPDHPWRSISDGELRTLMHDAPAP